MSYYAGGETASNVTLANSQKKRSKRTQAGLIISDIFHHIGKKANDAIDNLPDSQPGSEVYNSNTRTNAGLGVVALIAIFFLMKRR
jgi:hypothetical protein